MLGMWYDSWTLLPVIKASSMGKRDPDSWILRYQKLMSRWRPFYTTVHLQGYAAPSSCPWTCCVKVDFHKNETPRAKTAINKKTPETTKTRNLVLTVWADCRKIKRNPSNRQVKYCHVPELSPVGTEATQTITAACTRGIKLKRHVSWIFVVSKVREMLEGCERTFIRYWMI